MRLGFTITHQNPNSSQNSGQKPAVQRQRRQGQFHQQERSWHRRFGMLKTFYWLSWKGQNNNREILFQSFNQTRRKNSWEKTRFAKEKIIFHQDNAPAHKSVLAMDKLRDLHYELLEHPPYSPDLGTSDFCLFPKLKLFLAGQRFSSNQEAIAAVEGYFADLRKNPYRDGIMALKHRWNKYINVKGDYVEK